MAAEDYLDIYDYYDPNYWLQNEDRTMDPSLENVKCPDCEGPMVSRKSDYGTFWGCKAFPKCKGTRDSQGRSKKDREEYKRKLAEEKDEEFDSSETESKKGEGFTFNKK